MLRLYQFGVSEGGLVFLSVWRMKKIPGQWETKKNVFFIVGEKNALYIADTRRKKSAIRFFVVKGDSAKRGQAERHPGLCGPERGNSENREKRRKR